jgi:hypothetical protein
MQIAARPSDVVIGCFFEDCLTEPSSPFVWLQGRTSLGKNPSTFMYPSIFKCNGKRVRNGHGSE